MDKHFSDALVEEFEITEAKKKKNVCSSITYTTGCPKYNMDMFNKLNGTDNSGALSGTIDGNASTQAMSADTGMGDAGGMGEALEKKDIDFLVKDEEEAIKGYEDKINVSDSDAEKEVLAHIRDEEKEHIDELNDLADITAKAEEERSELTESSWVIDSVELPDGGQLEVRWEKGEGYQVIKAFAPDSKGISHEDFIKTYADKDAAVRAYKRYKAQLCENLTEAKRYVRRYYIRPQNIFCSNKAEIIKALIDVGSENCTIYTLNNLGDEKDVTKLTNNDIIYYYDDEILYDKNHVKVMDYDLYIKHEENRDKIETDAVSDATMQDVYNDRMTDVTELPESLTEAYKFNKQLTADDVNKLVGVAVKHKDGRDGIITSVDFDEDDNVATFKTSFDKDGFLGFILATVMYKDIITSNDPIWTEIKQYVTSDEDENKKVNEIEASKTDEERMADAIKSGEDLAVRLYAKDKTEAKSTYNNFKRSIKEGPWPAFLKNDKARLEAYCDKYEELKKADAENGLQKGVKERAEKKIKDYKAEAIKLSKEFNGTTKEWFKKYVKNIKFFIPNTDRVQGHAPKSLTTRLETLKAELNAQYPGIINDDRHFALQSRGMENKKTNYGWWGLVCETYFKVPVFAFPKEVRELVEQCIEKSQAAGHDAKAVNPDETKISNVYLGFAILDMFDDDFTAFDDDIDEAFNQVFEAYDATGKKLTEEEKEICCICGEEIEGYGNNPEPFKHKGRCCDACNIKFVIPARLAELNKNED